MSTHCSVIIPIHNRVSQARVRLRQLLRRGATEADVVMVGNVSSEQRATLFPRHPRARLIASDAAGEFLRACDVGARAASAELVVFLEPDTLAPAGWLATLLEYADAHPTAAVIGSKLVASTGVVQNAGLVICQDHQPRSLYAGFPSRHPAVDKSRQMRAVSLTCCLVRREPYMSVGGLDADLGGVFAETDLCLKLARAGHEIHYCHTSVFERLESVSEDDPGRDAAKGSSLFWQRWAGLARPDDLDYYVADGLLSLEHWQAYPIGLSVSPLLAEVDHAARQSTADELLRARAHEVLDLMLERGRLEQAIRAPRPR